MERFGMHHIALVLDVAKWKPPKPGCLGFDATIYALHTELDPSDPYSRFEIKVGGHVHLAGDAQLAADMDLERAPKDRRILKLAWPILIGRFDSFAPKIGWIASEPIDPAGIQKNIVEELAGELITSGVLDESLPPPAEPAKLFLHMDAMFEELPTDGELEVQGFVRDHSRETHYGA